MRNLLLLFFIFLFSQTPSFGISQETSNKDDTLKSFLTRKHKPLIHRLKFKHELRKFSNKILHGNNVTMVFNLSCGLVLFAMPEEFSQWNKAEKLNIDHILKQYKSSITKPLVVDRDHWYINYIGHPYQGGFYYNNVRSKGATALQSSLYAIGQTIIWEYLWEGGMEQPSIQDFITTPFLGILIGELTHIATIKMSKNGFTKLEKAVTIVLNPSFLLNGNFKRNK